MIYPWYFLITLCFSFPTTLYVPRHLSHFSNRLIFVLPHGLCTCGYPFPGSLFLRSLCGWLCLIIHVLAQMSLLRGTVLKLNVASSCPFCIPCVIASGFFVCVFPQSFMVFVTFITVWSYSLLVPVLFNENER